MIHRERLQSVLSKVGWLVHRFGEDGGIVTFVGDHSTHRVQRNQILLGRHGREYLVTIAETRTPRERR